MAINPSCMTMPGTIKATCIGEPSFNNSLWLVLGRPPMPEKLTSQGNLGASTSKGVSTL